MARFARLVVPEYPHHITQRGVRSIDIFDHDDDRLAYLDFMREEAQRFGVTFLAWCLMSNHVHLIAVPSRADSLARAIGEAHRRYTRMKNFAAGVRGYLFQGRFGSCVLDQQHLLAAGRYIENNPVKAGITARATDYPWSSARYQCGLTETDPLLRKRTLAQMVGDWSLFLQDEDSRLEADLLQKTRTGRPAGSKEFIATLEKQVKRKLLPQKPGRPRRKKGK
ncbi:transposase [Geothermobacter hydrogeniphilus]|uniref:Transposase n=1 Tax=Geothermobacter hydrogeniphilus TaxID=1969733 RepID=A0A2K2HEY9_9BACT|nr:transposase [Geothermobacter hydrogeniphilus]PNU21823.1 transposase [Geothermobacter hydrogeniphilus]